MNERFTIGPGGKPDTGIPFSYNFDCGPIISATKFKDSINLYSNEGNTDMNEVKLSLLPRFMQVDSSSITYFQKMFMLRC